MMLIIIILIVAAAFYVSDKMTSDVERNFWMIDEKILIKLSAILPLLLGCLWFYTFGFTDYREHLAFVGFPLSLIFLTYGFLLAKLSYPVVLLNCILAFVTSLFLTFLAISTLILPALVPAVIGFFYVFVLRKGLYRRFKKKIK